MRSQSKQYSPALYINDLIEGEFTEEFGLCSIMPAHMNRLCFSMYSEARS